MKNTKENISSVEIANIPLAEKSRMMVVDDNEGIRNAITSVLKSDYDITQAESGNRALEILYNDHEFDVITLDLEMPGLSGIDTLREIKKINPDIEVLILSAHSDVQSARGALKYGAYDYIDKPFGNKELRKAIQKGILRSRKVLKAKETVKQLAMVKAQLIESEKFSIIGQLVAGVSHEINNPLTAIIGFSELVGMNGDMSQKTKAYIDKIKTSALLCKNIVEKLLSFSRKNEGKREAVNINAVIKSSLELIEIELVKKKVEAAFDPVFGLPNIIANYFELQQVFLNLLNNSCYAVTEQKDRTGKITIKTEYDESAVHVIFQDNGPGIPEEHSSKIFEPLFTTKKRGEGTGLGLSICLEIIKSYNGDIFVGNTGEGACFIIELPVIGSSKSDRLK